MAIDGIVGDSIDRAVNIEMRFRAGLPRGVSYPLYEAARKKQKKPLTWLAAKLLKDSVKPGQNVFVVTGAGTPPGLPARISRTSVALQSKGMPSHQGMRSPPPPSTRPSPTPT